VRLHDNRAERPALIEAFGNVIQDAANLVVYPRIVVRIDQPSGDEASGGPVGSLQPAVELALRNGEIVPGRP
jgi:hypothetical protein